MPAKVCWQRDFEAVESHVTASIATSEVFTLGLVSNLLLTVVPVEAKGGISCCHEQPFPSQRGNRVTRFVACPPFIR